MVVGGGLQQTPRPWNALSSKLPDLKRIHIFIMHLLFNIIILIASSFELHRKLEIESSHQEQTELNYESLDKRNLNSVGVVLMIEVMGGIGSLEQGKSRILPNKMDTLTAFLTI